MERFLLSIFGFPVESGESHLLLPGRRYSEGIGKLTFCLMLFREDASKRLMNTEPIPFESSWVVERKWNHNRIGNGLCKLVEGNC